MTIYNDTDNDLLSSIRYQRTRHAAALLLVYAWLYALL